MLAQRILLLTVFFLAAFTAFTTAKKKKGKNKKKTKESVFPGSGFFVGKLNFVDNLEVDTFETTEAVNTLLTPKEAKRLCDADLGCAGFTYKGAKELGQRFPIYFFKYISPTDFEKAKTVGDWTWTSYRPNRSFVLIRGRPPMTSENRKTVEAAAATSLLSHPLNGGSGIKENFLVFNVLKGEYYSIAEDVDLKDFIETGSDDGGKKSSWMTIVNLATPHSLYNNTCDQAAKKSTVESRPQVHRLSCDEVLNKRFKIDLQQPLTFSSTLLENDENCESIGNCPLENSMTSTQLFEAVKPLASWQIDGKSAKREDVNLERLQNQRRMRASIHDRSVAQVKQMLQRRPADLFEAVGGHLDDLYVKLKLKRSSQLFIDYWSLEAKAKKKPAPVLANPPGTINGLLTNVSAQNYPPKCYSVHYLAEGSQDWTLIPSNDKVEIASLTSCATSSIHGLGVLEARLRSGDVIFVPPGWSYQIATGDREAEGRQQSVTYTETGLARDFIEDAASAFGEGELQQLKKALNENDQYYTTFRRFTEVLRQRRRRSKK